MRRLVPLVLLALAVGAPAADAASALSVTPSSIDLGRQRIGVTRDVLVTVTNAGTAPLQINSGSVFGHSWGPTSFLHGTCFGSPFAALAPGESCTFGFRTTPEFLGTVSLTLCVDSRSADRVCIPVTGSNAPRCEGLEVTVPIFPGESPLGTPGDDVIAGTAGADVIDGGGGNDKICGLGGDDTLRAGAGDDIVRGGDGDDTMTGASGADLLSGAAGNDTAQGGIGDDNLVGGTGDDELSGGDGNDRLSGGDGMDRLLGGDGDDRLFGGLGDDVLLGAAGADVCDGTAC